MFFVVSVSFPRKVKYKGMRNKRPHALTAKLTNQNQNEDRTPTKVRLLEYN